DEIESIRQFAPQTQRSLQELEIIEITGTAVHRPGAEGNGQNSAALAYTGHFCDYLPGEAWTVLVESDDLSEQGKYYLERVPDARGLFSVPGVLRQLVRFPSVRLSALPAPTVEASCHLRVESIERFSGEVTKLRDELDTTAAGDRVLIACHNEAEVK